VPVEQLPADSFRLPAAIVRRDTPRRRAVTSGARLIRGYVGARLALGVW
jgi:hypothetical protein